MAKKKNKVKQAREDFAFRKTLSGEDLQFVQDIRKQIDESYRSTDEQRNRYADLYKKRYGVRGTKNWPFPQASNTHIPIVDENVVKAKAQYAALVLNARPIVNFVPKHKVSSFETIEKAEAAYDTLFLQEMRDTTRGVVNLTDSMLMKGMCYAQIVYENRTENVTKSFMRSDLPDPAVEFLQDPDNTRDNKRSIMQAEYAVTPEESEELLKQYNKGKDVMVIVEEDAEVYDAPRMFILQPEDVVVPDGVETLNDAPWVCRRNIFMFEDEIMEAIQSGKFEKEAAMEVIAIGRKGSSNEDVNNPAVAIKQQREAYEPAQDKKDQYNIWEVACYYDYDGDGRDEKCLLTFCPQLSDKPLRFIRYPYEHPRLKWNIVKFEYEVTDSRYYQSRGMAEILDPMQTEVTALHNMKLDAMRINNVPMFKILNGGSLIPSSIRYTPGEFIYVDTMEDLQPVIQKGSEISYQVEEQQIRANAERRIGMPDFALTQGGGDARTAREITKVHLEQQKQFSLDATMFQKSWADVHYLVYKLWLQFGSRDIVVQMPVKPEANNAQPGQAAPVQFNPMANDQAEVVDQVVVKKSDLRGEFELIPNGNLGNTSDTEDVTKKLMDLQTLQGNPIVDQMELVRQYLMARDWRSARRLLKPPTQIQAESPGLQPPQPGPGEQGQQGAGGTPVQLSPIETNLG